MVVNKHHDESDVHFSFLWKISFCHDTNEDWLQLAFDHRKSASTKFCLAHTSMKKQTLNDNGDKSSLQRNHSIYLVNELEIATKSPLCHTLYFQNSKEILDNV